MTIIASRAQSIARKYKATPAVSLGGVLAVVAALAIGFSAAVIGNKMHHDWQAKIIRFTTQSAKPKLYEAPHARPAVGAIGS